MCFITVCSCSRNVFLCSQYLPSYAGDVRINLHKSSCTMSVIFRSIVPRIDTSGHPFVKFTSVTFDGNLVSGHRVVRCLWTCRKSIVLGTPPG
jgi:hypothetical protein